MLLKLVGEQRVHFIFGAIQVQGVAGILHEFQFSLTLQGPLV